MAAAKRAMATFSGVSAALLLAWMSAALADDEAQRLCADRPDCAVREVLDAGTGPAGESLRVAALALPSPDPSWPCRPHAEEYWLLASDAAPVRLLALCNDGYGAAGMGEDVVTVSANRLTHTQHGGSNWRWSQSRELQLSPLRLLQESDQGYWTVGLNESDAHWDWQRFSGETRWWSPPCDTPEAQLDDAWQAPYAFHPIPMLQSEAVGTASTDMVLGTCALEIGPDAGTGYAIWGEADAVFPDGGWMRVAMIAPDQMIVSVRQRGWTSGAASWLHDDHLELWLGPRRTYIDHCIEDGEAPRQWAIMMADGGVIPAFGDPVEPPRIVSRTARSDADGEIVSFRIALPEAPENLSVVFSKGDGQGRQLWMVATSALEFGAAETLGRTREIGADAVRCADHDGWLDLVEAGAQP